MATRRKPPARRKPAPRKPARRTAAIATIAPCLWFDGQAEEAARFYVSIFEKSKFVSVSRFPNVGQEVHGRPAGSVMTVDFVLNGVPFTALNGGPLFKFNEAVSLQVLCRTQAQIDHYWEKLSEGGDERAQACGWLKDKFGVSWQISPVQIMKLFKDPKSKATERAFAAMMDMRKLDIAALKKAHKG
jgi:predicted 3-demethylubiquinone-9 3-methyltransferase (glyoxalase superfamily)